MSTSCAVCCSALSRSTKARSTCLDAATLLRNVTSVLCPVDISACCTSAELALLASAAYCSLVLLSSAAYNPRTLCCDIVLIHWMCTGRSKLQTLTTSSSEYCTSTQGHLRTVSKMHAKNTSQSWKTFEFVQSTELCGAGSCSATSSSSHNRPKRLRKRKLS